MINSKIKNKWLNALRSGNYTLSLTGPLMRNKKNTTIMFLVSFALSLVTLVTVI